MGVLRSGSMKPFPHVTVSPTSPAVRYVLVDDTEQPVLTLYAGDPKGKERAEWLAAAINGSMGRVLSVLDDVSRWLTSEGRMLIDMAYDKLPEGAETQDRQALEALICDVEAVRAGTPIPTTTSHEDALAELLRQALPYIEGRYVPEGEAAANLAHSARNVLQAHLGRQELSR